MPNELLKVAVISPDRAILQEIAGAFSDTTEVDSLWTVDRYPDRTQLAETLAGDAPCVIFLDFSDAILARSTALELDTNYPKAVTAAIHAGTQRDDFLEMMQFGIREIVGLPIARADVQRAFKRMVRKLRAHQQGANLYAFLPARAGAGATTLAAHSAAAAARLSSQPTLLVDFDFRLGMTSFLFKLHSGYSVIDAIFSTGNLHESLDRMVSRRGFLDVLGSAPVEFGGINPEAGAVMLLDQLRQKYETLCVDLPGEMRDYEIETLHRATECFLVTTPDVGTLHMAKRKADLLQSLGLRSKVSVILNRSDSHSPMAVKDIETILQLPVRFTVPVADKQITEATRRGEALAGRSAVVSHIERIARRMTSGVPNTAKPKIRSFLETFSLSPVRDRFRQAR